MPTCRRQRETVSPELLGICRMFFRHTSQCLHIIYKSDTYRSIVSIFNSFMMHIEYTCVCVSMLLVLCVLSDL